MHDERRKMQKGDSALVAKLALLGIVLVALIALVQGLPTFSQTTNQQALESNGADSS